MMTLTLLKCCNMLESSEQSIVSPLLGLKSQIHIKFALFLKISLTYHNSLTERIPVNFLFSLRSFPRRVMRVTGCSWRLSRAQIMFWQLTILTTSFVVRHNFAFTAHSKSISESIIQTGPLQINLVAGVKSCSNVLVLRAQSVTSSLLGGL